MKKFLSLFLIIALMMTIFVGCSNKANVDDSTDLSTSDSVISDTTDNKVNEPEVKGDPIEPIPHDVPYKMAMIGDVTIREQRRVTYVVEITDGFYDIASSNTVIDRYTGEPLNCNYEIIKGAVCRTDGFHEFFSPDLRLMNDSPVLTIIVYPEDETFDENSVMINFHLNHYDDTERHEFIDDQIYQCVVNADVSELTTEPNFLHRSIPIKLGNGYYMFDITSGGSNSGKTRRYTIKKIYLLNGNSETDLIGLFDNVTYVNADGEAITDFGRLNPYINYDKNSEYLEWGVRIDDGELTEDEIYLALHIYPVFTINEHTMPFMF